MGRVLKWPVVVDGSVQEIGAGSVVHVDADPMAGGRPDAVAVWTWEDDEADVDARQSVVVVGTGHEAPATVTAVLGSVVLPPYAWHVLAVTP